MKHRSSSWVALVALLPVTALSIGCGSEDDPPGTPPVVTAGTGGSGGQTTAGKGGTGGSTAGSGGSKAGTGGSAAGTAGTAGTGGSAAGTGGSAAGAGGAKTGDGCDAPATSPSEGVCFVVGTDGPCNPVTNEGCKADEACDAGQNGFECFPPPNEAKQCEACNNQNGPFCESGKACYQGKCARYCCEDSDCGNARCVKGLSGSLKLGFCGQPECNTNADCKDAAKPACGANGSCVECGADTDCKDAAKPACGASGSCVECKADADCKDAAKPACGASGSCVECKADADCKDATKSSCSASGTCVGKGNCCEVTADIGGCTDSAIEKCVCAKDDYCCNNAWDSTCVKGVIKFGCGMACPGTCVTAADCTDPKAPLCNANTNACAECAADADCKDPAKNTCTGGKCVGKGNCCEATADIGGCTDTTVQDCVCAKDDYCCNNEWDSTCVKEVIKFGCGMACPGTCGVDTDCKDSAKPVCQDNACSAKCTKDAECVGAKDTCDTATGKCFQCKSNADCSSATSPICDVANAVCVGCVQASDCKVAGSLCENNTCIECKTDDECKNADKPFCSSSKCVGCLGTFDCKDPAKSVCVENSCIASPNNTCTGDDKSEPADDGAVGATDLTPTVGSFKEAKDHFICGSPSDEADYFKATVADAEGLTVTVDWTDAKQDVDVFVSDSTGKLYGVDLYSKPAVIKLTALPAGTYYINVQRFDGMPPVAAASAYSIRVDRSAAAKCAALADCAKEFTSQLFRGTCNATSGACEFIDGKAAVAVGGACDDSGDCVTGASCGVTSFIKDADKYAKCSKACTKDTDCAADQVCTTVFPSNFCTLKCGSNQNCPVDVQTAPASGPWTYLTCDNATGKCDLP